MVKAPEFEPRDSLHFLNQHVLEPRSVQQRHRLGRRVRDMQAAALVLHLPPVLKQSAQTSRAEERGLAQLHGDVFCARRDRGDERNFELIRAFTVDAAGDGEFVGVALRGFLNVHGSDACEIQTSSALERQRENRRSRVAHVLKTSRAG